MNRQQKEALVDSLKKDLTLANGFYVLGYKGVSVGQLQILRRKLRDHGAALRVIKMRLAKRVLEQEEFSNLVPYLREQRGVVFAFREPVAIAKVINDYAKECQQLEIVVGHVENEFFDTHAVRQLASLPSREVLIAQLLGMMQSPIVQTVGLCNAMLVRLLFVIKQIAQKRESEAQQ